MGLRLLTLFLSLYITADCANPLMPGAVTFVDGSVEAVDVERARIADAVPHVPVAVSSAGLDVSTSVPQASRPTTISPAVRWMVPYRGAVLAAPDPPPTSEDD